MFLDSAAMAGASAGVAKRNDVLVSSPRLRAAASISDMPCGAAGWGRGGAAASVARSVQREIKSRRAQARGAHSRELGREGRAVLSSGLRVRRRSGRGTVVAEASRTIALALALALARLASAAKVEEAAGPPCCAAAEAGEEE